MLVDVPMVPKIKDIQYTKFCMKINQQLFCRVKNVHRSITLSTIAVYEPNFYLIDNPSTIFKIKSIKHEEGILLKKNKQTKKTFTLMNIFS